MNKFKKVLTTWAFLLVLIPGFASGAATRFTSPSYGVESVIFGGTGTLRSSNSAIPPAITAGPTTSSVTTSSVVVAWTTDKASNSVVLLGTVSGDYTLQAGQVTDTTFFNHTVTVTNLTKGTTYFYKVRSSDAEGNTVESAEKSFTTEAGDITAPKITSGPTIARNSASLITITWQTDEVSNSLVEYGIDQVSDSTVGRPDELTLFHQIQISGLAPSQRYLLRVRSRDAEDNDVVSATQSFETLAAPNITEVRISDITLNSAVIQWKTTTPSSTILNYGPTTDYGETISDAASTTTHLVRLNNLTSGTPYYFRISGLDQSNNRLLSDEYVFQTVILPVISNVQLGEIGSANVTLTWDSSSEIDEFIRYEIVSHLDSALTGKKFTAGNDTLTTSHAFTLADLESGTEYTATVFGKDVFGNQAASSPITFRTKPDSEPPIIENIRSDTSVDLGGKQSVQVLVSFGLSELGTAVIEYGEGSSGEYSETVSTDAEVSRNKFLVIPGLRPGESYHFRIVAKDRTGNQSASADYLVLAPAQPLSLFDLIFGEIRSNFGWLERLGK